MRKINFRKIKTRGFITSPVMRGWFFSYLGYQGTLIKNGVGDWEIYLLAEGVWHTKGDPDFKTKSGLTFQRGKKILFQWIRKIASKQPCKSKPKR